MVRNRRQKKEMKMKFSKEHKPHKCWIEARRPLILTVELRNISKLQVLDVFLEPVLDFVGNSEIAKLLMLVQITWI